MEYIDWELTERSATGAESSDKDLSWNANLSRTPLDPVKDVLQPVNDILSPYHTFASVSGRFPISSSAPTPDMASPLSTTSSIDSIWTVCSLPTSPATSNPPGSDAELLPRWPYGGVGSIVGTNTTGGEANLASRVVPSAPALAVPLCNAPSPIASDYQEEPPISSVPPTPSPNVSSADYLTAISGDSLPVACDKLRHFLQAHYADTKPPGDLFGPFIQRLRKVNHCKLCSKVLENREQMNQHVMKHHCGHKPFACPVNECDHRDARQADLQKHLQKHSNVRLPCPACRKLFANKRNLVRHLDQLHPKFAHELVARRTHRRRTRRN